MTSNFDICIRGAGIVGHTLALLLAQMRLRVALVAPSEDAAQAPDVRAYALNAQSKRLLESVRCWPDALHATAVTHMDVFGDADGRVQFAAQALGVDALTWIVDVAPLQARLREATRYQALVEVMQTAPAATLTVICEGKNSSSRAALGIRYQATRYPQQAIAARVRSEQPHGQVARQWFHAGEVLALLPVGGEQGHELAMVWSVLDARVDSLMQSTEFQFSEALTAASANCLGPLRLSSVRHAWPLHSAMAEHWLGQWTPEPGQPHQTWVLAGDAAHSVHPLAGQGLNLGLADAGELTERLRARASWRALDDKRLLRQYERSRRAQVRTADTALDGLQKLFFQEHPAWMRLRNLGMQGFERSAWLKHWVAKQAMGV